MEEKEKKGGEAPKTKLPDPNQPILRDVELSEADLERLLKEGQIGKKMIRVYSP